MEISMKKDELIKQTAFIVEGTVCCSCELSPCKCYEDAGKELADFILARETAMLEKYEQAVNCLEELYATVRGESPSLLNEDSGGSAELDMLCLSIIQRRKGGK
jgi:hypothetical protein